MSDVFHTEIYEHKNGKKYHVEWSYDNCFGAPDKEHDGHGHVIELNFDPTDDDERESHLDYEFDEDDESRMEEEARLQLMKVLRYRQGRYDDLVCYDVWETLKKAKAEGWGVSEEWEQEHPEATEHDKLMHAIDRDFKYLYGWYNDDWHWCVVGVAPLDEDGEPDETYCHYCGGYESTILDSENKKWHDEVIDDQIAQVEWELKKELHKDQMELALT